MSANAPRAVRTVEDVLPEAWAEEIGGDELEQVNAILAGLNDDELALVTSWSRDFFVELVAAFPAMLEACSYAGKRQSSASVTCAIKRAAGKKGKSDQLSATLSARVRNPRRPREYAIDIDGQGRLNFGGVVA